MSTPSRRKNSSVVEQLLRSPHAYSFYQAVRLLERAALWESRTLTPGTRVLGARNPVALFVPPSTETVRIKTQPSFKFPEAEVQVIQRGEAGNAAPSWQMQTNFMSLTGSVGVMPYHYTELILQRLKQKDESLLRFLDLFNHRIISLFYQAGTKYRLPIEYERKKIASGPKKTRDISTQALLSLIGLGTQGLTGRLQIKDESLLFYSGLLTQQVRTTSGLKQILQDYFDIPVKIHEFIGQWQELIPDIRTRLASRQLPKGQNARLGQSAMVGHKGWFAQGKIRISLGPLNREQFYRFAPGTKALRALNDMVRMYVGIERDYDFIIEVKRRDIPKKITLSKNPNPIIGWNTWLSTSDKPNQDNNETLKITVSANRLK
ncbi:MAG: type VI secretion system baseplate subunit TssG [Cellvibrio sp.]